MKILHAFSFQGIPSAPPRSVAVGFKVERPPMLIYQTARRKGSNELDEEEAVKKFSDFFLHSSLSLLLPLLTLDGFPKASS